MERDYNCNVVPILSIQNRFIKLISNYSNPSNVIKFHSPRSLYVFKILLFLFKNQNYFTTKSITRNTRSNDKFVVPRANKEILKKNIYYNAPKFFNMLPNDIKDLTYYNIFKSKLKLYVIDYDFSKCF